MTLGMTKNFADNVVCFCILNLFLKDCAETAVGPSHEISDMIWELKSSNKIPTTKTESTQPAH